MEEEAPKMECHRCQRPVTFVAIRLGQGEFRLYDCERCHIHAWMHNGDVVEIPAVLTAMAQHYAVPQSYEPDFVEEVVMRAGASGDKPAKQKFGGGPARRQLDSAGRSWSAA